MKDKASRNRTIELTAEELEFYSGKLVSLNTGSDKGEVINRLFTQDFFEAVDLLPDQFVDLLFLDPPYNLRKTFNETSFKKTSIDNYTEYLDKIIKSILRLLKDDASVYVCGDWQSSTSIHLVLDKYFHVRNRITWEREKGRGAKTNWKNNTEDIWFCTRNEKYTFNVEDIKLKKRVIAPYKDQNGEPKDWQPGDEGSFRLTHPSNIWTDISIPFWSMPENTEHPTQKPEKLLAKLILASTNPGAVVLDPFSGSGTTCVVAKKLGRYYTGIELDKKYSMICHKRLSAAETNKEIQGYYDGVFWERNSLAFRKQNKTIIK